MGSGVSMNIRGIEQLQKAIEATYSGAKARKIRKEALNAGGDMVVERLKQNFEAFKDTGYSQKEIMRSNARVKNDVEELKVGWNGPHERWRLIHLNEFGYTKSGKQYIPRGFAVIAKTIQECQEDYYSTVARRLRDSL